MRLEAVVAVDDAAVQVVQVGGGKTAAVQLNHRAQLRRNDRHHVQDHPLGLVAAFAEGFHHLQALDDALALLAFGIPLAVLGGKLVQFGLQLLGQFVQVQIHQHFPNGFGADAHPEFPAVFLGLLLLLLIFGFGKQLILLQSWNASPGSSTM